MEKRLHEQIFSGNISQEGEKYKISKQEQNLIKFYRLIRILFNIQKP